MNGIMLISVIFLQLFGNFRHVLMQSVYILAFLCLNLLVLLTKFWNDDFVLYFVYLVKITVQFPGWSGYFFVVLLPLEPIAYPRPNEVKQM